jgi:spore germination cell wall hydrolase CwlJ-like protein
MLAGLRAGLVTPGSLPMRKHLLALPLAVLGLLSADPAGAATRSDQEAHCLALAIYWEAKNEDEEGMLAVASVVLNRVAHPQFPATVCAVVKQGGEAPPCQFSWWCDGKSDRPQEAHAWAAASRIAARAVQEPPSDRTRGALFFHSSAIDTPWVRKRQRTVRIGRHVFYR